MPRGRPRKNLAIQPAGPAPGDVGEVKEALSTPPPAPELPPPAPPMPEPDPLPDPPPPDRMPAFRFDAATRTRIRECAEVYLVCKNGAGDKTVHQMGWLKEVVQ